MIITYFPKRKNEPLRSEMKTNLNVQQLCPAPLTDDYSQPWLYNLPPKPLIPLELLATDPMVQRLESISAWSTLLLEEQKASIEFTRQNIQSLAQLLDDDKEMFHLRQFIQKLDNTCFACKELAWNPHIEWHGYAGYSRVLGRVPSPGR
ncbi:hypothetical protein F5878DRAFT_647807, partial [Lentinula raphanica]